jgi:hypothetical protein
MKDGAAVIHAHFINCFSQDPDYNSNRVEHGKDSVDAPKREATTQSG